MQPRPLPSALGDPLAADVLARRERLPRRFAPVELASARVRLRPLSLDTDVDALFDVSCGRAARIGERALDGRRDESAARSVDGQRDGSAARSVDGQRDGSAARSVDAYDPDAAIWRYMSGGPFADARALAAWLEPQARADDGLCLVALDAATGAPLGVANYLANHPEHLKVELGSIWYSPLVQGAGFSAEVTFLMLEHAFSLGYRRVEWKCDALNERSRRAALRMGFKFEGIQEAHYIVKGRSRDTAWFRLLDREWEAAAPRLRALFSG